MIKFFKWLFDFSTTPENVIIIKPTYDYEKIIELLRSYGINSIEEQYSNTPLVRGNISYNGAKRREIRLRHKTYYKITLKDDEIIIDT